MYNRYRSITAKLLIILIFFTTIFNSSSMNIVRADVLNIVEDTVVDPINSSEDLGNGNNIITNENTFIGSENREEFNNTEKIIEDLNKEEKSGKESNSLEINLEKDLNITNNISLEENININSNNEDRVEKFPNITSGSANSYQLENAMISYQAHVQDIGWQSAVKNGAMAGTTGLAKPIEALNIQLEGISEGMILKYRSHVRDIGWQEWKNSGELTGTTGKALSMESIEIKLEVSEASYDIMYRVHIRDIGWQGWKKNGETAGTTGLAKPIEAIEIKLVKNLEISELKYQTHVSEEGWTEWSKNGVTSGSTLNNQIEAFRLLLTSSKDSMIKYRSYVKNIGWQDWKFSGELSGTEGKGLPIEQIEILLNNAPKGYSIEYRIRSKFSGWSEWKKDGQTLSSNGEIITGIQARIKDNYSIPSVTYQTHVRNIGWQNYVSNGELAGTTGKALSIESIKIDYKIGDLSGGILYKTHVQDIGWQDWVKNNQLAGTTGKAKPIEAIQIKQESPVKGYKLKYRVHVRDIGWQEWKSEGEIAGTTGKAKPIEAIEIKFVEENLRTIVIDPGHNFGGDDGAYSNHNGITYVERDLNMQIAIKLKNVLESKGYNIILTRKPEDRDIIDMRTSLEKRVNIANASDAELFISIHQNSSIASSAKGVEVYYSTEKPNNGIAYSNKISKSKELASNISRELSSKISTMNRGPKDEEFYVVKNTFMPSILIECGFISNSEEAKKLSDSNMQQKIADSIADEVEKSLN